MVEVMKISMHARRYDIFKEWHEFSFPMVVDEGRG